MNLNKLRLKWKVFAYLLGFCIILLIVLWLFQTVLLDTFYKQIKIAEIRRNAALIINNIGIDSISEIISDFSNDNNITVTITDLNGRSLPQIFSSDNRGWFEENAALIKKARDSGGEIHEYITSPAAERFRDNTEDGRTWGDRIVYRGRPPIQSLIYVKTANKKSGDQFAVIIRAVISPVEATVTTLRYQLYYISCIILVLSVILEIGRAHV
jgi:hypothetical protein